MHRPQLLALAVTLLLSSTPSIAQTASPRLIPFQAQVTQQNETLVADGQYSVVFNFYDTAVGGQPVWSERHTKIGVTDGALNVFLGSINPIANVDFSTTKYLGITVDTDNQASTAEPEMVPRSVIIPAFHAKTAEHSENAAKLAGHDWAAILVGGANDPSVGQIRANAIETEGLTATQIATAAIGTSEIQDGAVGTSDLAPVGPAAPTVGIGGFAAAEQTNLPQYEVNTTASGSTPIPGLEVEIETTGRPVLIALDSNGDHSYIDVTRGQNDINAVVSFERDSGVGYQTIKQFRLGGLNINTGGQWPRYAPSAIRSIDQPPPGVHKYRVVARQESDQTVFRFSNVRIISFEL